MFNVTDYRTGVVTPASASQAAGGAGRRNVCKAISATVGRISAAGSFRLNLRDGASGLGTILDSWEIGVPNTGDSNSIEISGLNIVGSANTAMTLEFATNAVANIQSVNLNGIII